MLRHRSAWTSAAAIALACWGCGGGGGGGSNPPGTTTPPPSGSSNPCATAFTAGELALADAAPVRNVTQAADRKRGNVRGQTKGDVRELLWTHRAPREARDDRRAAPRDVPDAAAPAATEDVGEIAVIEDDGTIFL